MNGKHSFKILLLLVMFSSALMGTLLPMTEEISAVLVNLDSSGVILISSLFLIVSAGTSLIWAILAGNKFSAKTLLTFSTLEWSIFSLLTIFAVDFNSLLFYQIMTAIGAGASLPLTYSLIVEIVEEEKHGHAFGLKETFYILGAGMGLVLSGLLIESYPWFVPYIIISMGGFLCTILLYLMKDQKKIENKKIALNRGSWINFGEFKEVWSNRSNLLIFLFDFIMFIGIGAISQELITLFKNDYGFPGEAATYCLILVFGSQIPSGIIFGNLGDKLFKKDKKARIKLVAILIVLGSVLYIIAYSMVVTYVNVVTVAIFLVFVTLGAFFIGGVDPQIQATLGKINPGKIRSTVYAINHLTYSFGRSISLLLLGMLLYNFGGYYRPGYIILSIIACASSLILILLLKILPKETIKDSL